MSSLRIHVSIDTQQARVTRDGQLLRTFAVSTSARGAGTSSGSLRTPTGRFVVREMIGQHAPPDTIFRGRVDQGCWDGRPDAGDLVLGRILWLEGLDPHNRNTHDRFIYFHGTNHEDRIGRPASQGCVRLSRHDMVELFDLVEPGTEVIIEAPTPSHMNLIFFDCDSTLSTIEGIDELARERGPDTFSEVENLTHAAMNGEVPIEEVFPRRMDIIRPDRELCELVARRYLATITPGAREAVARLRECGWLPVILSGGFAPLILPLAAELGIDHVEAVPLRLNDDGSYHSFDASYPTTRNGGKPEVIRDWKTDRGPDCTVMVGDGISDLESRAEVDLFVGYGGVVARPAVRDGSDAWITDMNQLESALRKHLPHAFPRV